MTMIRSVWLIATWFGGPAVRAEESPAIAVHERSGHDDASANENHAVIAALIDSGQLEEADRQLRSRELTRGSRHRLAGLLAMARGDSAAATAAFEAARDLARNDPSLDLHLARAYVLAERYPDAIRLLEPVEASQREWVAVPVLLARAHIGQGRTDRAYEVLRRASSRFARNPAPTLELVALCANLGYLDAARAWALHLLGMDIDTDAVLAVMVALHRDAHALPILEQFATRFSGHAIVIGHLAHAYASAGYPRAAASLFRRAHALGGDFAFESADQFRVAGLHREALGVNALVMPRERQALQRFDILFEAGEMVRLLDLVSRLPTSAQQDPSVRYRMAYAHYTLGERAAATEIARGLEGSAFAGAARALLAAMGRLGS